MSDKVFLDTNIFIYSIDATPGESSKREIARTKVREHIGNDSGAISIQVLQEFYHVATHKIQVPLSSEEALEYMHYISILTTVRPDFSLVVAAVHLQQDYSLSFWDALILQAAKLADCSQILSEDLQNGFCLGDLKVINPFVSQ